MRRAAALMILLAALSAAGCARAPATCAVPDVLPAPPVAHAERRIVAAMASDADGRCRVHLRLPDDTDSAGWTRARDDALQAATVAAAACCATPRASNAADWPSGATAFDLAFDCAGAPRVDAHGL